MPDQTTSSSKTAPSPDRMSLTAFMIVLVLTSVLFISQALPYVN
jgi:hypothetical protein